MIILFYEKSQREMDFSKIENSFDFFVHFSEFRDKANHCDLFWSKKKKLHNKKKKKKNWFGIKKKNDESEMFLQKKNIFQNGEIENEFCE